MTGYRRPFSSLSGSSTLIFVGPPWNSDVTVWTRKPLASLSGPEILGASPGSDPAAQAAARTARRQPPGTRNPMRPPEADEAIGKPGDGIPGLPGNEQPGLGYLVLK